MYSNNFVCAVKSGGKVLREEGHVVYLPFDSYYSLLLKNLSSRRALVKIQIDGNDILFGKSLIVSANSSVELERYVNDCDNGPKFKFIQKTEELRNYRSDRIDDGLIVVKYAFEKPVNNISVTYSQQPYFVHYPGYNISVTQPIYTTAFPNTAGGIIVMCNNSSNFSTTCASSLSHPGITVPGEDSNQKFVTGYIGELEPYEHTIVIQLSGYYGDKPLEKPITVKEKKKCVVCGKETDFVNNYCPNCGHRLV